MLRKKLLIIDNEEIAHGYFLMKIQSPEIAKNPSPGQFLHIKCSTGNNLLLRRPLSIHRVTDENHVEILYKVVGKGTDWLSKRKSGDKIDCLGPLGNGFLLPETRNQKTENRKILVAGGIGIAPLIFLTEKLAKLKIKNHPEKFRGFPGPSPRNLFKIPEGKSKITVFLGAKTKDEVLCVDKFKKLGVEIHISTEDGSLGYKGLVSNLFKNNLSSVVCRLSSVIYACGPKGMLKEVALLSKKYKIPCQVSFEQFMGCGIGICNACVIRTKCGYKKVCRDGPVFDAKEIDWGKI